MMTPEASQAPKTSPIAQYPAHAKASRLLSHLARGISALLLTCGLQSLHASHRLELKQALENPHQVTAKNFPFRDFYSLVISPMLLLAGDRIAITGNKCHGEDDNLSCQAESISLLGMDLARGVRYTIAASDERAESRLESTLSLPCEEIFYDEWAQARAIHHDKKTHHALQKRAHLACSLLPDSIALEHISTKAQENDHIQSLLEMKLRAPNGTKLTIAITQINRARGFAKHNIPAIYAMIYGMGNAPLPSTSLQDTSALLDSSSPSQTPQSMPTLLDHRATITRLEVLLQSKTLGDDIYTLAESKKPKQDFYALHRLARPEIAQAQATSPLIDELMQAAQQFMLGESKRIGILFEAGGKGGIPDSAFAHLSHHLETLDFLHIIEEISRYGELRIIHK